MRWEDERYVKLYTRNTPEWLALPWQARGLFGLLMREADRAGVITLGKIGLKGIAVLLHAPWVEIKDQLEALLDDGCVQYNAEKSVLLIPNFIEAQEAKASDAARKRKSRELARDRAASSRCVTDDESHVTETPNSVTQSVTGWTKQAENVTPRIDKTRQEKKIHSALPGTASESPPDPEPLALRPPSPDLGRPKNAAERQLVDKWRDPALAILDALNAARARVNPRARGIRPSYTSLAGIADRLDAGKTAAECLAVIEVCEAESMVSDESRKYFDAVTPWRPQNFERKLAADPELVGKRAPPPTNGHLRPVAPVAIRAAPTWEESQALRDRIAEDKREAAPIPAEWYELKKQFLADGGEGEK